MELFRTSKPSEEWYLNSYLTLAYKINMLHYGCLSVLTQVVAVVRTWHLNLGHKYEDMPSHHRRCIRMCPISRTSCVCTHNCWGHILKPKGHDR